MKLCFEPIMSGSFVADAFSKVMDIQFMYGFSIQFAYGGTAPVGTFTVQGTNDSALDPTVTSPTWSDEATTVAVAGTGNTVLNFDHRYYRYVRVKLTRTSGTITANLKFASKGA